MRRVFGFVIGTLLFTSAAYAFAVYGAIGEKWQSLGGEGGPLGEARSDEADAQYGGRFNRFAYGSIYWHPETGAHVLGGSIGEKWAQIGFESYGYPITDELATPDGIGRYNHFRAVHLPGKPEASIYATPETGAHAISGVIRQKWADLGWERTLGYPTTDESTTPDGVGRYVHFRALHAEGKPEASIYWHPDTVGAHEVYGAIRQKWAEMGWERGPLGYPTSEEYLEYEGSPVRRQNFQKGSLWWSPETGVQLQPIVTPPPATPPATSAATIGVELTLRPGPFNDLRVFGRGFDAKEEIEIVVASTSTFSESGGSTSGTATADEQGSFSLTLGVSCPAGTSTTHTASARGASSGKDSNKPAASC